MAQSDGGEIVLLRRQIRDLHRSAAEISSFSLPAAVSRGEIDFRLRATGTSLRTKVLGFRIMQLVVFGCHRVASTHSNQARRGRQARLGWASLCTRGARTLLLHCI
jgi:hypothetical protein